LYPPESSLVAFILLYLPEFSGWSLLFSQYRYHIA
jgi:hypothetical protein